MPENFDLNCALQEGKRYGKAEFREIMKVIRNRKEVVELILGEEMFEEVVLTNFSPSSDCTKSGYDYTLSFKRVYRNDITTDKEVTIQKIPQDLLVKSMESSNSIGSGKNVGSLGGRGSGSVIPRVPTPTIPNVPEPKIPTWSEIFDLGKKTFLLFLFGDKRKG